MNCKHCSSPFVYKSGSYQARGQRIQRYMCRTCGKTCTNRTYTQWYRKKKQRYAKAIVKMLCEGCTLNGISRILDLNVKTVERYFLAAAKRAQEAHLKALDRGDLKTNYIQADELETFEHSHKRPLGIELAIRPKTGQIISAKVARIPIKGLNVSPRVKQEYAKLNTRKQKQIEMLLDIKKTLRAGSYSTLEVDGKYIGARTVDQVLSDTLFNSSSRKSQMWRINKTCLSLRHYISRLTRQTVATTKKLERLELHLALFVAHRNGYDIY